MFSFDDPAFLGSLSIYDPNVLEYIRAVEIADGAELEPSARTAINDFVIGCKADATWDAIKASCILAGARTLAGALVPLVGPAPTNFNFVPPDYNRKTGLLGDGATKYLGSGRNNNADPQNSQGLGVHITALPSDTTRRPLIGCGVGNVGATQLNTLDYIESRSRSAIAALNNTLPITALGFVGLSRSSSAGYTVRHAGSEVVVMEASQTPLNETINIYRRGGVATNFTDARLAFYFIGEALNLALLNARVTTLINAIGAAIP